jgi:hypothetical protein
MPGNPVDGQYSGNPSDSVQYRRKKLRAYLPVKGIYFIQRGSIVLQGKKSSIALQIYNTIVLQEVELDGKVRSVHFWMFGS